MDNHKKRVGEGRSGLAHLWHLTEGLVGLFALYSLAAHVFNKAAHLFSGGDALQAGGAAAHASGAIGVGLTVVLPDPLAEILIVCIVVGVITYIVLKYLCEEEWVKEPVNVKKCWEEVKWYNPVSWVKALVCTFVEVLKWVLKIICSWVEVLVTILVIACIVLAIIIIFA